MQDKPLRDTNTVSIEQVPYEVDGKTLFTETVDRICEQFKDVFRAFGSEWEELIEQTCKTCRYAGKICSVVRCGECNSYEKAEQCQA